MNNVKTVQKKKNKQKIFIFLQKILKSPLSPRSWEFFFFFFFLNIIYTYVRACVCVCVCVNSCFAQKKKKKKKSLFFWQIRKINRIFAEKKWENLI